MLTLKPQPRMPKDIKMVDKTCKCGRPFRTNEDCKQTKCSKFGCPLDKKGFKRLAESATAVPLPARRRSKKSRDFPANRDYDYPRYLIKK